MKRPISIAFQGGGAKLVGLVAAAEAIQELAADHIHIHAISGSSAGSIAAFLLAARADFSKVKSAFRKHEQAINTNFPSISTGKFVLKGLDFVWRGTPVFPARLFNDMIEQIMADCGINTNLNIQDVCKTPVKIIVSDVYQGQSVVIENGSIRDALRRSCAIPFIFGSYTSDDKGQFVDGGVFDNLPTDILLKDSTVNAPVFAIGFKPDPVKSSKTSFEYIISLVSSVITYKVAQSRENVGEDFVLPIETSLDTLDFNKMVIVGIDQEYDRTKTTTREFFNRWLSGAATNAGHEEAGRRAAVRLRDTEKKLINHVEGVFRSISSKHIFVRMTVDANCLLYAHLPDEIAVEQLLEIPADAALPGLVIPLIGGAGMHAETQCVVKLDGPGGDDVGFTQFLINDEVASNGLVMRRNSVVILFDGNRAISGRKLYVLKRETRYGFMRPLNAGTDKLVLSAHYWPADEVSIRLNLPMAPERVGSDWSSEGSRQAPERVAIATGSLRNHWSAHEARLSNVGHKGHLTGLFTLRA